MVCAQSLEYEIQMRFNSLKSKCSIKFQELDDYQILTLKKQEDSMHSELRELLDKISSLIQFIVPCGDTSVGEKMWKNIITMRNDISSINDTFVKNLQKTILDRDISEKKLKNSAGLNIQIPKFKGYYSEMVYSPSALSSKN